MTDEHFKTRSKRYATVVIRWVLVSAMVFVATMASGIYVTNHLLVKVYSATASMQIPTQVVNSEAYGGWAFSSPQSRALEAELENVESPEILESVVNDLGLDKAWAERVFNRSDPLTQDEAVHYLKSHLRPKFKHDSNVVEVTALSDDPKEAAQIANEVVMLYKETHNAKGTVVADAPGKGKPGAVQITAQAEVPFEPTIPNKHFCFGVAAALGGMLSVMIASAIEVCLLIARAEEASREMTPNR
jgi:capsular polysaccharide biosynthesis protein